MSIRPLLAVLSTCALLLAACGTEEESGLGGGSTGAPETSTLASPPDDSVATVEEGDVEDGEGRAEADLLPVGDDGVEGTASVEPNDDGTAQVTIELDDAGEATYDAAVRIGDCKDASESQDGALVDVPEYELQPIESGRSESEADLPEEIRSGTFALVVLESDGGDDAAVLACAELEVT